MDYEKVEDFFGWTPHHNVDDGIEKTIKWYKQYLKDRNIQPVA